jgi:hypothetical protein
MKNFRLVVLRDKTDGERAVGYLDRRNTRDSSYFYLYRRLYNDSVRGDAERYLRANWEIVKR